MAVTFVLLIPGCIGMVMEVHGSWPEGQGDGVAMPRGATGIDVYHITCTYELKRKVSHFAVDLHFDNLIVYIKVGLVMFTKQPYANEPRHEKTCLRGFRPGKTKTGLLSFRD